MLYQNAKTGLFEPKNPEKYIGNAKKIEYRSGLEKRFMRFCDESKEIEGWSSEEIKIPYRSPIDNRIHTYIPDNYIRLKDGRQLIIEIKMEKEVLPPRKSKKKRAGTELTENITYLRNQAKWAAAKTYCDKLGMEFLIITEKQLKTTFKPIKQRRAL